VLIIAALTTTLIGLVHSALGEKKVIAPLEDAGALTAYHRRLIRVSWHALTLFWFAIAIYLAIMEFWPGEEKRSFLVIMSTIFGFMAVLALLASKGRHLSWVGFTLVTILLSIALLS